MATTTVQRRVREILSRHLGIEPERTVADARLVEDLDVDSLDRIEIAMELEDVFDVEIEDPELGAWETVADVVACVEGKVGA